jgi:hypothetical protein
MTDETKDLAEKYILKSIAIPFMVQSDGIVMLGLETNSDKPTEN